MPHPNRLASLLSHISAGAAAAAAPASAEQLSIDLEQEELLLANAEAEARAMIGGAGCPFCSGCPRHGPSVHRRAQETLRAAAHPAPLLCPDCHM
eukprot:SAG22_NODE_137_length_18056_cov_9.974940_14_plen_95_part_00